jgi:Flp pilus assembly pilin Flp
VQRLHSPRQQGNALVEYVILLMAIFLLVVAIVVQYGADVQDAWTGSLDNTSAADEVVSNLDSNDGDGGCHAYYNAATGRWHDSDTGLFISFDDAAASGCS